MGFLEEAIAQFELAAADGTLLFAAASMLLCGVSPFTRVQEIDDPTLDRLVARAGEMLRRNTGPGGPRRVPGLAPGRLWVYRRSGQPCIRCGTGIQRAVQGEQARSTYFCPVCQSVDADLA